MGARGDVNLLALTATLNYKNIKLVKKLNIALRLTRIAYGGDASFGALIDSPKENPTDLTRNNP
jgi:hypothetical protein